MTKKLYWDDSYQKEFDVKVVAISDNQLILDQTCFYARGGGQVGDIGEINGIKVVDTIPDENKENVIHILEKEPDFKTSDTIHGKIDWEKRYKIMRSHSAAHLVDHFIKIVYPNCNLASPGIVDERKIKEDYIFPNGLDKNKLTEVEKLANEFTKVEHDIEIYIDDKGRRHWKSDGIDIQCGGTHPKNTREIGIIKIEKGKKPGAGKERIETTLLD